MAVSRRVGLYVLVAADTANRFVRWGLAANNQRAMSATVGRAIWWLFLPVRVVTVSATIIILFVIPPLLILAGMVGIVWFTIDLLT